MSKSRPALPAYVRLPDGLRFAGTVSMAGQDQLCFRAKQNLDPIPPEGLSMHLLVAGLPGQDEQLDVPGVIANADSREIEIVPDDILSAPLLEALGREENDSEFTEADSKQILDSMRATGQGRLLKGMRRFLVDLGDQLFDLSTSSRYVSGRHEHYDALNTLKRSSDTFIEQFAESLLSSLSKTEKDGEGESFADLEKASAHNLNLVALDEMDQKLAVDKIVSMLIEKHRVELECLTIRAALVSGVEPSEARTPFHPTYIVKAFTEAFDRVSNSSDVMQDTLEFFRDSYTPILGSLYSELNAIFVEAGVEPGLDTDIRENGSFLNPVEKRIIKSAERGRSAGEHDTEGDHGPASDDSPIVERRKGSASGPSTHTNAAHDAPLPQTELPPSRNRHDAMYDAVLNALETTRGSVDNDAAAAAQQDSSAEELTAPAAGDAKGGSGPTAAPSGPVINEQQLLQALQSLQVSQPKADSLGDLQPLESLIVNQEGGQIDRDGANRLSFVDGVFRTLHNNFEVSSEMAPSLSQLRVPLARLSLQEPKFFAQPDHPAHKLLDKLSVLASADHTVSRTLQNKVAAIVERIAEDYSDDSGVFEDAQGELDTLLAQQDQVFDRNIARVISGLEGQEKLTRAQRRVEQMLREHLDGDTAPTPLIELLDSGWRSSLVQLALREGENSVAWREESALLKSLMEDLRQSDQGTLDSRELKEMQIRLRALNARLNASNPGSLEHEAALRGLNQVLSGRIPLATETYTPSLRPRANTDSARVANLPRLKRWLKRVKALETGAKLRYRDKDGRRRHMRLVWISEDREQFAFVNERGQKIAELTAVQLARQLSRGAQPPTAVDNMSVLDQSMYETLEEAQKTLSFDRNRDSLTQLINGDSLIHQLQRTLRHAHSRGSEHAFMLLDIDNFGLVNDVFDETSGDQVLTEFARLLSQLNDRRALTARIREDEFGILLTFQSAEEACQVADKIRADIADSTLSIGGEVVSFTVSIGIAAVMQSTEDAKAVVSQAHSALELAKTQGRDQVVVYDLDQQDMLNFKRERESSRKRLDEAMSTDSLVLRAQPIVKSAVDGSESATHHYEVLLALRDEDGELQGPHDFIMSAERFGYITLVDRWVIRETFAWISCLMDSQKEIPEMSINLSGTSITDNDFLEYVLEQISEYGVGTSRLCFEITETGAIDNLPRAADFVRTLKNLGCKFSLDDFGTGLASHKYLKELPVDYVKIDGTFITDIHQNRTDYAMAKSINDLAHFLGQKTVAECVESLEIVPSLREIGIDYLQGWGIGMPRELSEITEELANIET
ncbi:MAG: DUF1631 family protein [Congregibacter sp.]